MPFPKFAFAAAALAALSASPAAFAEDGEADTGDLHIPGYDTPRNRAWLEFEVAPEIVSHNPLGSASRISDETRLSGTLITRLPIGRGLELEFDAGPSMTVGIGSDTPFETSLAAGLELRTRPGASGFSAFMSYSVGRDFEDFFGRGIETSQTLKAGVRYGGELGPLQVGFELAPRWVNSTEDQDDYLAAELWLEAVAPIFANGIDLIAEGVVDRRWYRNVDPVLGDKRRDWRFEAFLGLDFAGAIAPGDGGLLRSLGVGIRWINVDSNAVSADRSSIAFLPAITLRVGL